METGFHAPPLDDYDYAALNRWSSSVSSDIFITGRDSIVLRAICGRVGVRELALLDEDYNTTLKSGKFDLRISISSLLPVPHRLRKNSVPRQSSSTPSLAVVVCPHVLIAAPYSSRVIAASVHVGSRVCTNTAYGYITPPAAVEEAKDICQWRAKAETETTFIWLRVPDASGHRGRAYALGGGDVNPGSNTVTGTFLLNDHHAYMLFDSGADKSFVSNTFSALLDITPYALDVSYAIELADGRTSETNTVLMGCTLGLLGHPFNIDLMPIELGSFDIIIGMDYAVIVCDEKIVRIPYGNEILIVQGDKGAKEKRSKLSIISCEKAQKYIEKGCQLFLAQVTVKEDKDKSEEKQLEDVPTVRDFPEVFPEDLPGLPPTRQVEFQIDLVPGAAPVARAPY
ncbi:putative reverse transcriptase domain-containing protein, partial [Tanacetum coccineum]